MDTLDADLEGPICRFAVVSDTHLGGQGTGRWHNRTLSDDVAAVVADVVAQLNTMPLEFVVVTGDITSGGTADQFQAAARTFAPLRVPVYAVTGNHDTQSPRSRAALRAAFPAMPVSNAPGDDTCAYAWTYGGWRFVALDAWWVYRGGGLLPWRDSSHSATGMAIPSEQVAWLAGELATYPDQPTVVFSHVPAVPMARSKRRPGRKDAGILHNATGLRVLLRRHSQVIAWFAGHQHFNQITVRDSVTHAVTSALVEYPMMFRCVTLTPERLIVETGQTRRLDLVARSLVDNQTWPFGSALDRTRRRVLASVPVPTV